MQVVDVVCYNGEPIMERRLRYLDPCVDVFVVVEAWETFSGERKDELFYHKNIRVFEPYAHKMVFVTVEAFPADARPTEGPWVRPENWRAFGREKFQRDAGLSALEALYDDGPFLACVCDADEIPRRELLAEMADAGLDRVVHLDMPVFCYDVRYLGEEHWFKPFVLPSAALSTVTSLDEERNSATIAVVANAGWHMAYFMGPADVVRKIESFSHTELNTPAFKSRLEAHLLSGRDIFGSPLRRTPPKVLASVPVELLHG